MAAAVAVAVEVAAASLVVVAMRLNLCFPVFMHVCAGGLCPRETEVSWCRLKVSGLGLWAYTETVFTTLGLHCQGIVV